VPEDQKDAEKVRRDQEHAAGQDEAREDLGSAEVREDAPQNLPPMTHLSQVVSAVGDLYRRTGMLERRGQALTGGPQRRSDAPEARGALEELRASLEERLQGLEDRVGAIEADPQGLKRTERATPAKSAAAGRK
jgi:hypothetical protein